MPGRASNLDSKSLAIKVLARWDSWSYPEGYPPQSRAVVGRLGICWRRMSRLVTRGRIHRLSDSRRAKSPTLRRPSLPQIHSETPGRR